MSHAYRMPIRVWRHKDANRSPAVLRWRGNRYRVLEILEEWHLADRWWVSAEEAFRTGKGHSDRFYYRIRCQVPSSPWDLLCEIYFDREQNVWVMDRILD